MNLLERSQSIVGRLKAGEKLPFNLRAAQAAVLVPEVAVLLVDLAAASERHDAAILALRLDLDDDA